MERVLQDRLAALKAENKALAKTVPYKDRAEAALLGAFCADASALGTHWIYDPEAMAKAIDSMAPEYSGWEGTKRVGPFYTAEEFPGHYTPGSLSPYGEQLTMLTNHTASAGKIDGAALAQAQFDWAKAYTGRPDHATKEFLENMEKPDKSGQWPKCGADDSQANCFIRLVPVTVLYAGRPERAAKVEEAIRVAQNNDTAVKFGLAASAILEAVLLGSTVADAVAAAGAAADADAELAAAFRKAGDPGFAQGAELIDFLGELSRQQNIGVEKPFVHKARSCALPNSFMGPLQQLMGVGDSVVAGDDTYIRAVRENIVAAGDTCSRGILLGAILGAAAGSVPAGWVAQLQCAADVRAAAKAIVKARGNL